jgi:hypothetical protein
VPPIISFNVKKSDDSRHNFCFDNLASAFFICLNASANLWFDREFGIDNVNNRASDGLKTSLSKKVQCTHLTIYKYFFCLPAI